jgi:hypothetical protein
MMNATESKMFDIYIYETNYGDLIGVDPAYDADSYKAAAHRHLDHGYAVKVVDTHDGVIVYTLG